MNIESRASELRQAKSAVKAISPFSSSPNSFDLEEAYQIQNANLQSDLERGKTLVGYKMGLTSKAKQADVGVDAPIRGYLLKEMRCKDKLDTANLIHPRIEPEICVRLNKTIRNPLSQSDILRSIDSITIAVEVLDSRYESFKFELPDVVADNTSAAHYFEGTQNLIGHIEDLRLMGVIVKQNGKIVRTGVPAAVLGDPLLAIEPLVKSLSHDKKLLEAGFIVLTGGLTASLPVLPGDCIEVLCPHDRLSFQVI